MLQIDIRLHHSHEVGTILRIESAVVPRSASLLETVAANFGRREHILGINAYVQQVCRLVPSSLCARIIYHGPWY